MKTGHTGFPFWRDGDAFVNVHSNRSNSVTLLPQRDATPDLHSVSLAASNCSPRRKIFRVAPASEARPQGATESAGFDRHSLLFPSAARRLSQQMNCRYQKYLVHPGVVGWFLFSLPLSCIDFSAPVRAHPTSQPVSSVFEQRTCISSDFEPSQRFFSRFWDTSANSFRF